MTQKDKYLAAGLKLMPSGRVNNYQLMKLTGRLGSMKDHTWIKTSTKPHKGYHTCCESKRDYYHKIGCKAAGDGPDDLSDLKDI